MTGREFYKDLSRQYGGQKGASFWLNQAGIKGITYFGGRDGRCYVVFDDQAIKTIDKIVGNFKKEERRTVKNLVDEIKKAMPYAKDIQQVSSTVTVTLQNGNTIKFDIKDAIELSGKEAERARKEHGIPANFPIEVNGVSKVINGEAFIALSRMGEIGTTAHELVHIASELYLTKEENDLLRKVYGKQAEREGRSVDEVIADRGRDLFLGKESGVGPTEVKGILNKLWKFINNLKNMFSETYRANKILDDIYTGKVFDRTPNQPQSNGPKKYSISEVVSKYMKKMKMPTNEEAAHRAVLSAAGLIPKKTELILCAVCLKTHSISLKNISLMECTYTG